MNAGGVFRRQERLAAALALALTITSAGCHQVPVTGRRAVNLVADKEVTKASVAMFEDLKRQYRVSRDRTRTEQVMRVGDRIAKVVFWDMPDADWEFVVFENSQINAFATAGGKVGVFSGLFRVASTDDQLAAVLAHEIAHVTAKHIHEKLSQEMAADTVGAVGVIGLGVTGAPGLTVRALSQVYGVTAGIGGLSFDRAKEKEADHIGLMYMARAGYDPQAAIGVLEALESVAASQPMVPAMLSTHPSHPERILALMDAMPKALRERELSSRKVIPAVVR